MRSTPWLALLLLTACDPPPASPDAGSGPGADAGVTPRRDGGGPPPGTDAGPAPERDAGPPIEPDPPGPSDVDFAIDTFADRRAISPLIYGINGTAEDAPHPDHFAFFRQGGNRWTAYNWENNASNAGEDWFNQNDGYLGGGDTPGEAPRAFAASALGRGAALVTIPMIGYVARDKRGDGDVWETPDFLNARFVQARAVDPGGPDETPDPGDDAVYQDGFVAFMESRFGDRRSGVQDGVHYSLDNEPDLWTSTHPRLRGVDGSVALTYAELWERTLEYASMIRERAPNALVYGPVSYGFNGYVNLQDAPDAGGRDFLAWYLDRLAEEEASRGHRLVDVLDVHWYPEIDVDGTPIESDSSDGDVAHWRMQAARSLFDPDFEEPGWIGGYLGEPIRLLPRYQAMIAEHAPGVRLAITEYYYGGGDHVSGGIAQADVLGAFGREGLFAASLWHLGRTDDRFIHGAFSLYRAADRRFGDVSVRASTTDLETTSVWASADDARGRVILIAINKTAEPVIAGIAVRHGGTLGAGRVARLDADHHEPVDAGALEPVGTNAYRYEMPPFSASSIVLEVTP